METVNKKQLEERLKDKLGITQEMDIVSCVFDEIGRILSQGGTVEIKGFGKFSIRERNERMGYNPRTQKQILIPASKVPHFQASIKLKKECNHGGQKD